MSISKLLGKKRKLKKKRKMKRQYKFRGIYLKKRRRQNPFDPGIVFPDLKMLKPIFQCDPLHFRCLAESEFDHDLAARTQMLLCAAKYAPVESKTVRPAVKGLHGLPLPYLTLKPLYVRSIDIWGI